MPASKLNAMKNRAFGPPFGCDSFSKYLLIFSSATNRAPESLGRSALHRIRHYRSHNRERPIELYLERRAELMHMHHRAFRPGRHHAFFRTNRLAQADNV